MVQVKIDDIQKQFSDLKNKVDDSLEQMEEALPLAQRFEEAHTQFLDWVDSVEPVLRAKEGSSLDADAEVQVKVHVEKWLFWLMFVSFSQLLEIDFCSHSTNGEKVGCVPGILILKMKISIG